MNTDKLKFQLFAATHAQLVAIADKKKINKFSRMGTLLPHVTLQQVIFSTIMDENPDLEIETDGAEVEAPSPLGFPRNWYVIYVHYGKEQSVIQQIVDGIRINAIPNYKFNVESGLIPPTFKLSDIILDIAYPYEFDMTKNAIVENYKSYIFVDIDTMYDRKVFYDIIEPFFKSIREVVGFVGVHHKSPIRLKQQYSVNGRSVLKWYNDKIVVPRPVVDTEYVRLQRQHSTVGIYDSEDNMYQPGEPVWYVFNSKTKVKRWIVKSLDFDTYQVRDRNWHKCPVKINQLRKFTGA